MFLKTHFTNFINLDVSRVTCFPEFPNRPLSLFVWFVWAFKS
jgi:urate oxidase